MNIKAELLKEHSKKQTTAIVNYIGNNKNLFAELMKCMLSNEYRLCQRASWAVSICLEKNMKLISPYWKQLVKTIQQEKIPDAVKRNIVRIFQFVTIPKKYEGEVVTICFQFLNDKNEAIAVRVFSMSVIANCCKLHPDLKAELQLSIEEHLPYSTAGFKSRGNRILKSLSKQ